MSQSTQQPISVSAKDLPLCCPRPAVQVWNLHPRVYLPIEASGDARCPYCGTHYVLDSAVSNSSVD